MKKIRLIIAIVLIAILGMAATFTSDRNHHRNYEQHIEVEEWMTKPFDNVIEEPLFVETWMTKPFLTQK